MSERPIEGEEKSILASRRVFSILIALLLISVGTIVYILATSPVIRTESLPVVEIGDMVYVNYIGYYADHPGGWVFDTNDRLVGLNDSIPKSLYFQKREPSEYSPLNFTAGTATNLLKPFVDGVVGMTVTQTKRIFIPIDQGYPIAYQYVSVDPINMTAPMIYRMNATDFESIYNLAPSVGMTVKHYFWEWNTTILDVSGDEVTLQNEPSDGQIVSSFGDPANDSRDGWYQKVVSKDRFADAGIGRITVKNYITSQDAYQKKGTDYNKKKFTLIDVNETAGTFVILYNETSYIGELAGRALYFDVTVSKVMKS